MKTVIHRSEERGSVNHGWLNAHHSFSFGQYNDTKKIHFGALRVLNDDLVSAQNGFGTHPHDNMEIVSVILEGSISHKDSMGNSMTIQKEEIQIMSAGTGITHSEYNLEKDRTLNLLQIWVFPKVRNIKPRYDQVKLNIEDRENKIQTIIAPDIEGTMWINQDAYFSRSFLREGTSIDYNLHMKGNGVYIFLIDGAVLTGSETLSKRDAIGIWEADHISLTATKDCEILYIEVPMEGDF